MAEEVTTTTTTEATPVENTAGENNAQTAQDSKAQENKDISSEAIEKYIQSQVDKYMAEERKKTASLQKELEKERKEKMTAEEIKKYDDEKRERELTERDNAITERENRLFAIEQMKEIGLDDGSKQSLDLVDFVMNKDKDAITERVKAFKNLVDRFVSARVEQTFKANGRVPNGGNNSGGELKESNIAVELGKKKAEAATKSNEILKHYYGG